MDVKAAQCRIKAAGEPDGLEPGQYRALVSVFGSVDSVGDVVMPGAFAKSLAEWDERGDPIPVVWSHDWSDPFSHVGHVTHSEETDDGLVITAQLDLDNPKAEQVYRLLKGRRVTQHSFAYDVLEAGPAERDGREITELRELKVHEVGPCLVGANQDTELLAAKARSLAGAAAHGVKTDVEVLRTAYDTLGAILADYGTAASDETSEPDGSDSEDTTGQATAEAAADDDPPGKSAAQPPRVSPAQVLASITVDQLSREAPCLR